MVERPAKAVDEGDGLWAALGVLWTAGAPRSTHPQAGACAERTSVARAVVREEPRRRQHATPAGVTAGVGVGRGCA